jgi:hypothetical protein
VVSAITKSGTFVAACCSVLKAAGYNPHPRAAHSEPRRPPASGFALGVRYGISFRGGWRFTISHLRHTFRRRPEPFLRS